MAATRNASAVSQAAMSRDIFSTAEAVSALSRDSFSELFRHLGTADRARAVAMPEVVRIMPIELFRELASGIGDTDFSIRQAIAGSPEAAKRLTGEQLGKLAKVMDPVTRRNLASNREAAKKLPIGIIETLTYYDPDSTVKVNMTLNPEVKARLISAHLRE